LNEQPWLTPGTRLIKRYSRIFRRIDDAREKGMNRLLAAALLCTALSMAQAAERWETLPATPQVATTSKSGYLDVNGAKLFYRVVGQGSPVVLLHGGLANSDYWGNQVKVLAPHHTVILLDSRGHGRSGRDAQAYGYDLMADDVVALLDRLKIKKADVVGWSDPWAGPGDPSP
jgi:predicted alpha/beta-fold hydrolase